MDFKDYVKFANEHPVCYFATTENGQPHVRAMGMFEANENGFYFNTESNKALYKQLMENPSVELCFHAPTKQGVGTVMRVIGKVEWIDDLEFRGKILEARPFLKNAGVKGPEDPLLAVFRVANGEAYFWTMANNMKESEIERCKF